MKEIVKVLVPSYKRAKTVLTTKAVANCSLVVPESQVEEYKKFNDVEVIGHPDSVKGISNARQWMYETFGNIMMLDDDIERVNRLYTPGKYSPLRLKEEIPDSDRVSPEMAYDLIQQLADTTKQMGAFLFGFTSAVSPRDVRPQLPFSLKSYVKGTTMGMLEGSKLKFPTEKPGQTSEDHYITLLNIYHHRFHLVDNRFSFRHTGTFKTVGGCSEYRTVDSEKEAFLYLKRMFGDAIELKGASATGAKRSHEWERIIKIPF